MVRINQEQQDRIMAAAMREFDIASDHDRLTVKLALLGAAKDPYDLRSLLDVFTGMVAAVSTELKVEAGNQGPPSATER